MASIQSNYDINVAKRGMLRFTNVVAEAKERYMHYLRIELGPCRDKEEALTMLEDTRLRYPAPEFKVTMTYRSCVGRGLGGEG